MTILTSIPNGAQLGDIRATLNDFYTRLQTREGGTMPVLTQITNGASYGDIRLTFNNALTRLAALEAGGTPALPTVTLSSAQSHNEGNSGATLFTYTVTRSSSSGAIAVPWSFAAGSTNAADYTGGTLPSGGTVNMADGVSTGTIVISVTGDTTVEPDESFTVSISAPSGYQAGAAMSAAGTILNDDAAQTVPAGRVASYRPPATGTNGAAVTSYPESVNGYNALAASGQEPTYVASAEGGKPGLQYGGSKRSTIANASSPAIANALNSRTFSIFMCVKNITANYFAALLGFNEDNYFMIQTGGNNGQIDEFGFFSGGNSRLSAPALDNGWHVIGVTQSANFHGTGSTVCRLWIDGTCVAVAIDGSNQTFPSITSDLTIGAQRSSDGQFPCSHINLGVDFYDNDIGQIGAIKVQKYFASLYGKALPWAGASKFYATSTNSIGAGVGADRDYYGFVPSLFGAAGLNLPYGRYTNGGFPAATVAMMEAYAAAEFDGLSAELGIPVVMIAWEGRNTIASTPLNQPQAQIAADAFKTFLQNRINAGITRIAAATIGNQDDTSSSILNEYSTRCAAIPAALTGASLVSMTRWDQDAQLGIGQRANFPADFNDAVHQSAKANYPTTESGQPRMALVVMKSAVQAL